MIKWAGKRLRLDIVLPHGPTSCDIWCYVDQQCRMIQAVGRWMSPAEDTTILVGIIHVEGTIDLN